MEVAQDFVPVMAAAEPVVEEVKKSGFLDTVLSPPDWLTQSYVEDALRRNKGDPNLRITKYDATPCTKPGDNFVGVIFRAKVSYETRGAAKSDSFIIKLEPFLDGPKKDMMANTPLFKTEGRMYTEVLPIMQELLKNIKDPEIIAPNLIHYNAKPAILIFQDIAPDDFVMQHMPVPLEKTALVAQKLGKFHALSFYMNEERGESKVVQSFNEGMFGDHGGIGQEWDFVGPSHKVLCESVRSWGMETLADKLVLLQPHVMEKLNKVFSETSKSAGIKVLNHGDFHIRNLLFRYDDPTTKANFEAIRFIDFQISVYGTPAIDLSYLLSMIADAECRELHRDRLLKLYHDEFKNTLNNLGFLGKIPTLVDFQIELLKNGFMEYFVTCNFLSLYYMNFEESWDFDMTNPEAMLDFTRRTFEQPEYKAILMRVLPEFLHKGILEI